VITAVTLAELSVGPLVARSDDERAARQAHLQQAEADFEPLPFDAAAARAFGRVAASLRGAGRKTSARAYDAMIAATAMANDLAVYTCNPGDFEGIGASRSSNSHTRTPRLAKSTPGGDLCGRHFGARERSRAGILCGCSGSQPPREACGRCLGLEPPASRCELGQDPGRRHTAPLAVERTDRWRTHRRRVGRLDGLAVDGRHEDRATGLCAPCVTGRSAHVPTVEGGRELRAGARLVVPAVSKPSPPLEAPPEKGHLTECR